MRFIACFCTVIYFTNIGEDWICFSLFHSYSVCTAEAGSRGSRRLFGWIWISLFYLITFFTHSWGRESRLIFCWIWFSLFHSYTLCTHSRGARDIRFLYPWINKIWWIINNNSVVENVILNIIVRPMYIMYQLVCRIKDRG